MQAVLLATGNEIRTGAIIDTNSAYIAEKLEMLAQGKQRSPLRLLGRRQGFPEFIIF
mgnify:CR=1 FL=1